MLRPSPLKRSVGLARGKGLKRQSNKRRRLAGARRKCLAVVRERSGGLCECRCSPDCTGRMDTGHEPLKRSRGGDPTDPAQVLAACHYCNSWIEDHDKDATRLGLSVSRYEGRRNMNSVEQAIELGQFPHPGMYRGIEAATYHALDRASSHRLGDLERSPAHMRWNILNPKAQTPAMALGEAAHVAVLEPDDFSKLYMVAPDCDRRTKAGKETWEAFQQRCVAAGAKALPLDDAETCTGIRESVWAHPAARSLLESRSATEVSVTWKCRQTGVDCKLRADALSLGVCFDVKTCEDASRDAFERSIFNFGYARQAAMYMRGLNAHESVDAFVLIAVEKAPPYAVAVYRLEDDVLAAADEQVVKLLELYGKCEREQRWPAYSDKAMPISVPVWARAKMGIE